MRFLSDASLSNLKQYIRCIVFIVGLNCPHCRLFFSNLIVYLRWSMLLLATCMAYIYDAFLLVAPGS